MTGYAVPTLGRKPSSSSCNELPCGGSFNVTVHSRNSAPRAARSTIRVRAGGLRRAARAASISSGFTRPIMPALRHGARRRVAREDDPHFRIRPELGICLPARHVGEVWRTTWEHALDSSSWKRTSPWADGSMSLTSSVTAWLELRPIPLVACESLCVERQARLQGFEPRTRIANRYDQPACRWAIQTSTVEDSTRTVTVAVPVGCREGVSYARFELRHSRA